MISPIESLAFSMHANPGVYAVLAGSGLSRAAKIFTGWEITIDLVRKLAAVRGERCDPDPEQWYWNAFGKEPDYSELLDAVYKTPAARQQVLQSYVEPTDEERDEGTKQPTTAHHAIAALAAQGFIRVVVTTNFDRLFETALEAASVTPVVVSTPDQVRGTLPLIHTRCCVVKLHGDYLDSRILNTQAELDAYDEAFDRLLNRIFDEFGLIVCGWSAAWDGALRKAICRAPSRRFTTYWATRGQLEGQARRLADHRRAEVITIADADDFFDTVHHHVESLQEFAQPHPLSTEAAVASLKRYLPEPRHRIRLSDLVGRVVQQVVATTSGEAFSTGGPRPDTESVTTRVRRYEAACSTLLALAPVGGFWAEVEHVALWQRALRRLGATKPPVGRVYTIWEGLARYPATLLLYALGIGAVEANRLEVLGRLLKTSVFGDGSQNAAAVEVLPPSLLLGGDIRMMRVLEGMTDRRVPFSDWIHNTLRLHAAPVVPDENRYTLVFDKLELLLALGYIDVNPEPRGAPDGGVLLPPRKQEPNRGGDRGVLGQRQRSLRIRDVPHLRRHRADMPATTGDPTGRPWQNSRESVVVNNGGAPQTQLREYRVCSSEYPAAATHPGSRFGPKEAL